jgi:hypothetical protein
MKNSYLNDVLNFGVEIGVIKKKQKYIVKNLRKEEK